MSNLPEVRDAVLAAAVKHGVVAEAAEPHVVRATRSHGARRRRRATFLGVLALGLGSATAAAAQLGLFSTNEYEPGAPKVAVGNGFPLAQQQEWPALRGSTKPAPEFISKLFPGPDKGFNAGTAREISTPAGAGYVFPAQHGGVCLAAAATTTAPDGSAGPPDWGIGCSHLDPSRGLRLASADEAGNQQITALIPDGATVEVVAPTSTRDVKVEDGVVNVTLPAHERLEVNTT